ncbi:MAG: nucleotidyltransferase domain-containing protein [Betaproteobacteria bacterium]|nr:nucleotidyltransferase domain-containing protein [Betaproteobacteria bacterium]
MNARLSADQRERIVEVLRRAGVVYALVFGSGAQGRLRPESDLDIAVAAERPVSSETRYELISRLAAVVNRPVDLVDLKTARGVAFARAIQGDELFCDRARAKGEAQFRRVSLVAEDLAFAKRSFSMARSRMFR